MPEPTTPSESSSTPAAVGHLQIHVKCFDSAGKVLCEGRPLQVLGMAIQSLSTDQRADIQKLNGFEESLETFTLASIEAVTSAAKKWPGYAEESVPGMAIAAPVPADGSASLEELRRRANIVERICQVASSMGVHISNWSEIPEWVGHLIVVATRAEAAAVAKGNEGLDESMPRRVAEGLRHVADTACGLLFTLDTIRAEAGGDQRLVQKLRMHVSNLRFALAMMPLDFLAQLLETRDLSNGGDSPTPDLVNLFADVTRRRYERERQWGDQEHIDAHTPSDWLGLIRDHVYAVQAQVNSLAPVPGTAVGVYRAGLIEIATLALIAAQSYDRKAAAAKAQESRAGLTCPICQRPLSAGSIHHCPGEPSRLPAGHA